ncbi:MAG: class I SAM-dependent methyltransferase [Deltaproteobacteria bacterium]|nr:class I SAM-dependent methyltransferase [Deltaproteobacteria bacterium]MBW1718393.1 class I SAM-dependent methyltransferase [Deltaproteobacteria bacterium]MBW1964094.1 class I SAM-dependent methyltransferase [Deltaproteobacteria bacterium]MBW2080592.1 class I SAM-dependent methyltransferase [Deltaproteobacteria bacterium]MBW2350417.1 class I SAM-dependent methyltransferase [Deltaproteobacteria bacterium]
MSNFYDKGVIPQASKAFDKIAETYDSWYDHNPLFQCELNALNEVVSVSPLSLEVGVGSGRFSQAMGIRFGVDPAPGLLALAKSRGVVSIQAMAESLPFQKNSLEQIFFIFSLCFLEDSFKALEEAAGVLKTGGLLIIGFVPKDSNWGNLYEQKKQEGHLLYKYASFFYLEDLLSNIDKAHFRIVGGASTLFQSPKLKKYHTEKPIKGLHPKAGFIVLLAERL